MRKDLIIINKDILLCKNTLGKTFNLLFTFNFLQGLKQWKLFMLFNVNNIDISESTAQASPVFGIAQVESPI